MEDIDATITKEEAELMMFNQPKNNILQVSSTMNNPKLIIMIRNYFMNFDKVEIQAVGSIIGVAVNAVKSLQDEEYLTIEKFSTDLVGESKFKPMVSIIVDKKKR